MNIKKIVMVGLAVAASSTMALDYVEVIDVKARQRYPWNGLVDIDFELDSKATEPYLMVVRAYDRVGKTNFNVRSVFTPHSSVSNNPCMVTKDASRIVWDASADLPKNFKSTNVVVTCRDFREVPHEKLFCVIDVSGGPSASSYPVSYLDKVPKGGWGDEYKTTKIVFRRIDAGKFMMGSPDSETNRNSNEDLHEVTISKSFYIGVFELTDSQFAKICADANGGTTLYPVVSSYVGVRGDDSKYSWPDSTDVDPASVIGQLRRKTGISTIDLPTEAQWEYAARGLTKTALNTGYESFMENMILTGRFDGNVSDGLGNASSRSVTYVGCYQPNAYGLYDMLGNAREWCLDAWTDKLGKDSVVDPVGNPVRVLANANPGNGGTYYASRRVVKGGGFFVSHFYYSTSGYQSDASLKSCRSAYRTSSWCNSTASSANPWNYEGFRLVIGEAAP